MHYIALQCRYYLMAGCKMKTLTIRGIDPELSNSIKKLAGQKNISVNKFLIEVLKKIAGLSHNSPFKTYDDLDALAGGWTEEDEKLFLENTSHFRKIDAEMWK